MIYVGKRKHQLEQTVKFKKLHHLMQQGWAIWPENEI